MNHGPRIDLYKSADGWRWRMWASSSIVGGSTEAFVRRIDAVRNLESVTAGSFREVGTAEFPEPFGLLHRIVDDGGTQEWQVIPVRLLAEP